MYLSLFPLFASLVLLLYLCVYLERVIHSFHNYSKGISMKTFFSCSSGRLATNCPNPFVLLLSIFVLNGTLRRGAQHNYSRKRKGNRTSRHLIWWCRLDQYPVFLTALRGQNTRWIVLSLPLIIEECLECFCLLVGYLPPTLWNGVTVWVFQKLSISWSKSYVFGTVSFSSWTYSQC